jgi:hypothetical protein
VSAIIDEMWLGSMAEFQYLITWRGYGPEHDSWVSESDITLVRGRKKVIDTWQEEKLTQERRVERTTNTMLRDKTWTMAFFVREACAKTSPYYRHNQGQKLIGTMQEKTTKDADGNSVTSMKPKMPMKHNNTGCFKHQTIRKIERVPCGSASWTLFGNSQCFKIPSRDVDLQLTGDVQRIAFSVLEDCREFMYE